MQILSETFETISINKKIDELPAAELDDLNACFSPTPMFLFSMVITVVAKTM
jgi:hypothetical protein